MSSDLLALVREGVRIVGGIVIACVIMLGLLAIFRDGSVAATAATQLIGAIQWGLPVIAGMIGLGQIVQAYAAGRSETSQQQQRKGE